MTCFIMIGRSAELLFHVTVLCDIGLIWCFEYVFWVKKNNVMSILLDE